MNIRVYALSNIVGERLIIVSVSIFANCLNLSPIVLNNEVQSAQFFWKQQGYMNAKPMT